MEDVVVYTVHSHLHLVDVLLPVQSCYSAFWSVFVIDLVYMQQEGDIITGPKRFRSTWTYGGGVVPSLDIQCKVFNVNLKNWTVDLVSKFDGYHFYDVQIGSPYLHYSNGEGLSWFPEIGAVCMVCIPSDTSPPFVSCFLMPVEVVDVAADDQEGEGGTGSRDSIHKSTSGASFAGGRPTAKPGDMWLRTRDDNFVILHRGGVLQLGSTELAQRIYIPLNNLIMDISQNYAHHNSNGSIVWGLQEGPATGDKPSEFTQSFRVLANDKYADVRVKAGKVSSPLTEVGDNSFQEDLDTLGIGADIWVYEVAVSPEGFEAETGINKDTASSGMSFKFAIDRAGGGVLKAVGSLLLASAKKVRIHGREGVEIISDDAISIAAKNGLVMDGGAEAHLKGDVVRLGKGNMPVATQGSLVQITMPFMPMPAPGPPLILYGIVLTGNASVMT